MQQVAGGVGGLNPRFCSTGSTSSSTSTKRSKKSDSEMRRLSQKEKVPFQRSRWLLLKNPWNLSNDQKERLSTLVQWNLPIVRAYYFKEAFQLFWLYRQPNRAGDHLKKWMRAAMRCRVAPGNFTPRRSQIPEVNLSIHPARVTE